MSSSACSSSRSVCHAAQWVSVTESGDVSFADTGDPTGAKAPEAHRADCGERGQAQPRIAWRRAAVGRPDCGVVARRAREVQAQINTTQNCKVIAAAAGAAHHRTARSRTSTGYLPGGHGTSSHNWSLHFSGALHPFSAKAGISGEWRVDGGYGLGVRIRSRTLAGPSAADLDSGSRPSQADLPGRRNGRPCPPNAIPRFVEWHCVSRAGARVDKRGSAIQPGGRGNTPHLTFSRMGRYSFAAFRPREARLRDRPLRSEEGTPHQRQRPCPSRLALLMPVRRCRG